jgi:hypothetical protein
MDLDHDRHFKGKLASLTIADHAMTGASCLNAPHNTPC